MKSTRTLQWGVLLSLAIATMTLAQGMKSDEGLMTATVRDGRVWVYANVPQSGAIVRAGFTFSDGTARVHQLMRYVRPGQHGLDFPIPNGAKAVMIKMHDNVNRGGMCPISGGVCSTRQSGLITGEPGCFCRTRQYDSLGWLHLTE